MWFPSIRNMCVVSIIQNLPLALFLLLRIHATNNRIQNVNFARKVKKATIWHENSLGILATHSHYRNRKSGICEELFIFIKSENSFWHAKLTFISKNVPTHQINFIKVDFILSLVSKVWVSMFLFQRTHQISEINFKMK